MSEIEIEDFDQEVWDKFAELLSECCESCPTCPRIRRCIRLWNYLVDHMGV